VGHLQEFSDEWQKTAGTMAAPGRSPILGCALLGAGVADRRGPGDPLARRPDASRPTRRSSGQRLAHADDLSLGVFDGRGGDLPWLHEAGLTQVAPDSRSGSRRTAKQMAPAGDLVKVTSPHGAIELPAYPTELVHAGVVAVAMGQGHRYTGTFAQQGNAATGTQSQANFLNVGVNPIELLPGAPDPASGGLSLLAVKVSLARTGARRPLAFPAGPASTRMIARSPSGCSSRAARELELRGKPPEH
jgi:hypothetical protein